MQPIVSAQFLFNPRPRLHYPTTPLLPLLFSLPIGLAYPSTKEIPLILYLHRMACSMMLVINTTSWKERKGRKRSFPSLSCFTTEIQPGSLGERCNSTVSFPSEKLRCNRPDMQSPASKRLLSLNPNLKPIVKQPYMTHSVKVCIAKVCLVNMKYSSMIPVTRPLPLHADYFVDYQIYRLPMHPLFVRCI